MGHGLCNSCSVLIDSDEFHTPGKSPLTFR